MSSWSRLKRSSAYAMTMSTFFWSASRIIAWKPGRMIVAPETVAAQSPRGLRVLYVAVSRATQRLTVLTTSPQWRDALTGGRPAE